MVASSFTRKKTGENKSATTGSVLLSWMFIICICKQAFQSGAVSKKMSCGWVPAGLKSEGLMMAACEIMMEDILFGLRADCSDGSSQKVCETVMIAAIKLILTWKAFRKQLYPCSSQVITPNDIWRRLFRNKRWKQDLWSHERFSRRGDSLQNSYRVGCYSALKGFLSGEEGRCLEQSAPLILAAFVSIISQKHFHFQQGLSWKPARKHSA